MKADIHSLEIKTYEGYLILKVNKTPKIKFIGLGSLLADFNRFDVKISDEALNILKDSLNNLNINLQKENPSLEILSETRIWWPSNQGIIIPPNELMHIYAIPVHTTISNDIDEQLKNIIKKQ